MNNKIKIYILIALFAFAAVVFAAKWSDYGSLSSGNIVDTDTFLLLDVSDPSLGATGTQKQYAWSAMKSDIISMLSVGFALGDASGVKVTPSATNNKYSGITMDRTAGETLALGDAVYYKSDGKLWKADADAAASMPAIGIIVVGGNAEATVTVLTHGTVTDTDWNFGTVGGYLYVSETGGAIEDTLSNISDENDVVQILGIALSADTIFVNPSLVTVVLAAP
jgi:hypothetical protein